MVSQSDGPTHRILTLPAIRPCESVSPATLLSSLISLTRAICDYKSKAFPTNGRNVRRVIRLIGNLLIFLEEIRSHAPGLSSSVTLCLSELHFVFQKVLFLLEDCSRSGARVWMAFKSEKMSHQFWALVRVMSVALDVLPLHSLDLSIETKELVSFVTRQSVEVKIDVMPDDLFVLGKIQLLLSQFENGIVPIFSDLKLVLDHLGISCWSECNKEVKFLESEIELESLTRERRDSGVLSSLVGFMTYCRCTVFDSVDVDQTLGSDDGICRSSFVKLLNADDFRCPISLEIMVDPVIIATGQTYDRYSIQKWFNSGNFICPKTGKKILSKNLVPNLALKSLIKQYCLENSIKISDWSSSVKKHDITRMLTAGSVAAEEAMKMVAKFLFGKLVFGKKKEKIKAAYEIRFLAKTSIFNRYCLVEAGVVPKLLDLLILKKSATQENAIAALLNLSKYCKSKRVLVAEGGLEIVLEVLQHGLTMEARQHAAGTIFYLSSVEKYSILIGKIPKAIPALFDLIVEGTHRGKKNALVAIFGLLMHSENHYRAIESGIVPLLVNILECSQREDLRADSLAILTILAEKLEGATAVLNSGALDIVVNVLCSSSSRAAKEYCVCLLLALCVNGGVDVVVVLVTSPSLMGPLYSLLTEGSSRASKKARSLIRILHQFHEKSLLELRSTVLLQDRFIHV